MTSSRTIRFLQLLDLYRAIGFVVITPAFPIDKSELCEVAESDPTGMRSVQQQCQHDDVIVAHGVDCVHHIKSVHLENAYSVWNTHSQSSHSISSVHIAVLVRTPERAGSRRDQQLVLAPTDFRHRRSASQPMRNMQSYLLVPFVLCCIVFLALPEAADASECSACGYLARNCSDASDGVDVCDVTGGIQIDDVFCNGQECSCANGHECVSTVVGCSTIFQARTRRRCVGNATLSRRFTQCAVDQDLTSLSASNVAQDWIYFKQGHKCQSMDCLAVKMFHHSGLVQCGNLLAVWKTTDLAVATSTPLDSSSMDGDVVYHFIADGSRAKDMKAGTFLYSVPWSTKAGALLPTQAQSTATGSCYVLQTRNQPNSTCEGVYLQFDASVEFANSDEYVMSKLSWPVWLAVIGSVAAAIASVAVVSVVIYRSQHMDVSLPVENDEDGGLLYGKGNLRDSKDFSPINATCPGTPLPVPGNGRMSTDLRQRAAPDVAQLEAGACTTAL